MGYDFMVDRGLNTWLIEINASPALSTQTEVCERLVPKMFDSLLRIVLDLEHGRLCKDGEVVGGFECIYFQD